jgi:hypothetical protein
VTRYSIVGLPLGCDKSSEPISDHFVLDFEAQHAPLRAAQISDEPIENPLLEEKRIGREAQTEPTVGFAVGIPVQDARMEGRVDVAREALQRGAAQDRMRAAGLEQSLGCAMA